MINNLQTKLTTLSATLIDEEGNETIDTMVGVPFVDDNGNFDVIFVMGN